jgi:hypothetical protein
MPSPDAGISYVGRQVLDGCWQRLLWTRYTSRGEGALSRCPSGARRWDVLVVWWLVGILVLAAVVPLLTAHFANTTLPPNARTGNVVDFFSRRFRRDRRPK